MPVHDWSRVSDGTFHDFHYSWVLEIKRALKRGLLPSGYYVMAEQLGGDLVAPDVLTLQAVSAGPSPEAPLAGTATLTEAPPLVHARTTIARDAYVRKQRTLVIRHTSDDRIVALIEVLSAGNKSSRHAIRSFLNKVVAHALRLSTVSGGASLVAHALRLSTVSGGASLVAHALRLSTVSGGASLVAHALRLSTVSGGASLVAHALRLSTVSGGASLVAHALRLSTVSGGASAVAALDSGIHLLLVDVHLPGPRDLNGIHGAVLSEIGTGNYVLSSERPLTAVAYIGGTIVEAFVAHFAVGEPIPQMPLFLTRENYVAVPLEAAYLAAWEDVPSQYQEVLLASS